MGKVFNLCILILLPLITVAQMKNDGRNTGRVMPAGRLYGKILDGQTGKPVEFASVTLLRAKDSGIVSGMLSKNNGDFNLENLPPGKFIVKINYLGYQGIEKNISLLPPKMEQDLGNFRLQPSAAALQSVNIVAQRNTFTLGLDKKVFNVEKSLTSIGGTATDVLRQMPTVNVDIDGNVSLRNGSPTIFVDGKQSPLTLDQIPADQIQSIEVITNPSAKYDASGASGIINIVLKKNRKPGFNGMVMGGLGTHGYNNAGFNLNLHQNPVNITASYFLNSSNMAGTATNDRYNLVQQSYLTQHTASENKHLFQVGRMGVDYNLDNRNTLSLNGSYGGGDFNSSGTINSQYLNPGKITDSSELRRTTGKNGFRFLSSELNYTHNFVRDSEQLVAQVSYRRFSGPGSGTYATTFYDESGKPDQEDLLQQYDNSSNSGIVTIQADYTDPFKNGKARLEAGAKGYISNNHSIYEISYFDYAAGDYIPDVFTSYDYRFNHQTYAAYANYINQLGSFSYEAGLRFEQYLASGRMADGSSAFSTNKPGLFPSIFLTQQLGKHQQLQLNYSRRVDEPDFRQLSPRIDYTDPQNLRQGNPRLLPEHTNSFELSYNNQFGANNLLATLYFRNTNDLITSYVIPLKGDTLLNTYINAETSNSFGAEITLQNAITRWWNFTTNANAYQTRLKASDMSGNLSNSGFSWFLKMNSDMRLPANFSLQLTGNYQSPVVIPQGKIRSFGTMDIALQKSFLKNRAATLTLSLSDVFNTRKTSTHTNSEGFFIQDAVRKYQSQVLKLSFSYRFGKSDTQLFRRKNNRQRQGGDQDMQQMEPDAGG